MVRIKPRVFLKLDKYSMKCVTFQAPLLVFFFFNSSWQQFLPCNLVSCMCDVVHTCMLVITGMTLQPKKCLGFCVATPLPAVGKRSCERLCVSLNNFLPEGNGVEQAVHIIKFLQKKITPEPFLPNFHFVCKGPTEVQLQKRMDPKVIFGFQLLAASLRSRSEHGRCLWASSQMCVEAVSTLRQVVGSVSQGTRPSLVFSCSREPKKYLKCSPYVEPNHLPVYPSTSQH